MCAVEPDTAAAETSWTPRREEGQMHGPDDDDEAFYAELAQRAERGELSVGKTVLSGAAAAAFGRRLIEQASSDLPRTPEDPQTTHTDQK